MFFQWPPLFDTSYLTLYPFSLITDAIPSSHLKSAQLNVKKNWKAPKLSFLANTSYLATCQYFGVPLIFSSTLYSSFSSKLAFSEFSEVFFPLVPLNWMFLL